MRLIILKKCPHINAYVLVKLRHKKRTIDVIVLFFMVRDEGLEPPRSPTRS